MNNNYNNGALGTVPKDLEKKMEELEIRGRIDSEEGIIIIIINNNNKRNVKRRISTSTLLEN